MKAYVKEAYLMNRLRLIMLSLGVGLIIGCQTHSVKTTGTVTALPKPVGYLKSYQFKMQAAHHWNMLAKYEAKRIFGATKHLEKPIYIHAPADKTPFVQAFQTMLQTNLVNLGATITINPVVGGLNVSYYTQVVEHKDRGYTEIHASQPGSVGSRPVMLSNKSFWDSNNTSNSSGWGWTWRSNSYDNGPHSHHIDPDPSDYSKSYEQGGLGRQAFNWGYSNIDPTEVMITTQIVDGQLVLYSSTHKFYYNPGDTGHYRTAEENRSTTFGVVGESSAVNYAPQQYQEE